MDNLFQGLQITIMGFLIVFCVLSFICLVLCIFNIVAKVQDNKAKKEAEKKTDIKVEAPAPTAPVTTAPVAPQEDLELIAVITAAIAVQTNVSPDRLVVRSLRRVSSWNKEAVTEQQNNNF